MHKDESDCLLPVREENQPQMDSMDVDEEDFRLENPIGRREPNGA
jgi:hypothetical protein